MRAQAAEIGGRVAAARRLQRLTAAELAGRAGVSRDSVSRLEHGDPGVSLAVLLKVCSALGLRPLGIEDPLAGDAGRAAALAALPQRVRRATADDA